MTVFCDYGVSRLLWDLNPHSLTAKAAAPEPVPMITPVKEFATPGMASFDACGWGR